MINVYQFPVVVQKRPSTRLDQMGAPNDFLKPKKLLIKNLTAQNNLSENRRTIVSWNSAPR